MTFRAWLIKKSPIGETSAALTFFTAELGLVTARYKGGRLPKKNANLQSFMPVWFNYQTRYALNFIQTIETIEPTLRLKGEALLCAWYVNELIFLALRPDDANTAIFRAYETTLINLQTKTARKEFELLLRQFEWILLKECGYQLDTSFTSMVNVSPLVLQQLMSGLFTEESLKQIKPIMRQAIDQLVDGRPIRTRNLFIKT